jgi:aquaporin Z
VSQPAHSGWHWRIWAAEGAGTGLMMLGGLSAVCLTFGQGSFFAEALPSDSVRRLVVGALFAACVSLVAVSPLGRLSGAHLNPAVTVSFRVLGRVSGHDVGGYLVAQLAGALTGTALVWVVWGSTARSVVFGQTADLWIFLIAPIVGALALALLWRSRDRGGQPKTAKLFHDPNYPCCLGTEMPAMPVRERDPHSYLPVT